VRRKWKTLAAIAATAGASALILVLLQSNDPASALLVASVSFGMLAGACSSMVMDRMERAGWNIPALPLPDLGLSLYLEYWNIAPYQSWSRWPLLAIPVALALALVCLLLSSRFS
jgi:hypothetical protein